MDRYHSESITHIPSPGQVDEGRARKRAGDRLTEANAEGRPFFCRTCGKEERGVLVPRGWYTLMRATGSAEQKPHRLGLYCSLRCLDEQMPRLFGIEDDLGAGFTSAPSPYRQIPTPGGRHGR